MDKEGGGLQISRTQRRVTIDKDNGPIFVTMFLCLIIILNQVAIMSMNYGNRKRLEDLQTFHVAAKASFDGAAEQLDVIHRAIVTDGGEQEQD